MKIDGFTGVEPDQNLAVNRKVVDEGTRRSKESPISPSAATDALQGTIAPGPSKAFLACLRVASCSAPVCHHHATQGRGNDTRALRVPPWVHGRSVVSRAGLLYLAAPTEKVEEAAEVAVGIAPTALAPPKRVLMSLLAACGDARLRVSSRPAS